jgi:hypothetical protein
MRKIKLLNIISTIVFMWILLVETSPLLGLENKKWDIFISKSLQVDEAIKVALKDLQETGIKYGLIFTIQNDNKKLSQNSILIETN